MAFIVNSSPRSGLLFEPSRTVADASTALIHAIALSHRGMRLIKIKDVDSGEEFDERGFRKHMAQLKAVPVDQQTE
jgi:hypothetical protein